MDEAKKTFKECVLDNIWFKILSLSSIVLMFISLFLPPTGVIDPSVVAASGELIGWGALFSVIKAIDKGKNIEMKHGETTITVRKKIEENDENGNNNPES